MEDLTRELNELRIREAGRADRGNIQAPSSAKHRQQNRSRRPRLDQEQG